MTREELEEFENQLIRETRTSMTMNFDTAERMTKLGIKETVAKWKDRLEQEPCEDTISRKALLEEIENGIKAGNYEEGYEEYPHINDMHDIIECIKYADSVQPKPKTDVLDKIRAEIKALSNANPSYWYSGDMVEREDVLEIINEYMAESEG